MVGALVPLESDEASRGPQRSLIVILALQLILMPFGNYCTVDFHIVTLWGKQCISKWVDL